MDNTKNFYMELHNNLDLNGFTWFGFYNGVHGFMRQEENNRYSKIECVEDDLYNGNIEFCCLHGITMGKQLLLKAKRISKNKTKVK